VDIVGGRWDAKEDFEILRRPLPVTLMKTGPLNYENPEETDREKLFLKRCESG